MTRQYEEYIDSYLQEVTEIVGLIDRGEVASLARHISSLRRNNGRLFIFGVGGSAANASHAVNDFRKILGIESYSPLDNVSELTARINDDGWDTSISRWLKTSKISSNDAVLVFSVGGGSETTSQNLVCAMQEAEAVGAKILSIVSRSGGQAKKKSDCCVLVPIVNETRITPHAEEWQAVLWHLIVNCVAAHL
tara:strand:- start:316 stop:894 length:579 start_codon:yes stop_codon:yes gene_type:complete